MEEVFLSKVSNYSAVFYLPMEFGLVADGIRPRDVRYQQTVDQFIVDLLVNHRVHYIEVRGSLAERVRKAVQALVEGGVVSNA